jgi:oxygen-independent coproporphyrinogen-3 oxidase
MSAPARIQVPGEIRFAVLPPLALYVHLPWCVRKCPYCDFNSHERASALPEADYVSALIADLEGMLPSVWGRRIVSIFIGGGTPSLFSPEAIERMLSEIRARITIEPTAEITLEANPGPSRPAAFAATARPASTAFRSACRASTRRCSRNSVAFIRLAKQGAQSRPRSRRSTT